MSERERNEPSRFDQKVARREILCGMGASLMAVPLSSLLACAPRDEEDTDASPPGTSNPDAAAAPTARWATGGTAAMLGTSYPDPFAVNAGIVCELTCSAGLGPCYARTLTRRDISEGRNGLPVRLSFLVLDEHCKPLPNATVNIWHCGPDGLYSGDDSAPLCNANDPTALAARWFRGVQPSDVNGRVDFDTCFPGLYVHRAIHIHVTVRIAGVEYLTLQLLFDDALDDEIVATQPIYRDRGPRDTRNTADFRLGGSDLAALTFHTNRLPNGAMLAWKTLVVRSSPIAPVCAAQGADAGTPPA
jgi:protocatechuate 3,4-dioxygenase beta subunit